MSLLTSPFTLLLSLVAGGLAQTYSSDSVSAGYHVLWSYEGTSIPQDLIDAAKAGQVGGIIFFGENVSDDLPSQIQDLQDAYASSDDYPGFPLLIVTDQEGGEVNRLPGGPTLSAKDVGQSSDPASAGSSTGSQVASVFANYNTNGNLAPVLGVYRSAGDFLDQYERSYGNTSSLVSECIGPYISSLQSNGVAATAKHFPGLGAAAADANTDAEPVTIDLSLDELRSIDEAPYVTAIQNNVEMVMPSWALYPALDSEYPSGLSSKWLRDELRGRLGFQGVTISDALEAGALQNFGDTQERSIQAISAGMDILLCAARNTSQGADAVSAIVSGLRNGDLSRADFDGSTQRIINLRQSLA